jgi:hypothetical protein
VLPGLESEAYKFSDQSEDANVKEAVVSIAISLKRIADAMQAPNEYGEVGGAAIAGSIRRALQG